jgi:hypothetical protein
MAIHTCLVTYIFLVTYIYVRPNLVVLVFVRPHSSYVRPKLKVIGQMSCQVKYLFAALHHSSVIFMCQNDNCIRPVILHKWALGHTHCHQVSQDTIINLSS